MSTSTIDKIKNILAVIIFALMVAVIFVMFIMKLGNGAGDYDEYHDSTYETAKMIEEYNNEN